MKITVELSDSEVREICRVTGEKKKGPAIRRLVTDALMLKRREKLAQKFIDAEWGVELKDFEAAQAAEQVADKRDKERWRH
jgi:hypothetical protein